MRGYTRRYYDYRKDYWIQNQVYLPTASLKVEKGFSIITYHNKKPNRNKTNTKSTIILPQCWLGWDRLITLKTMLCYMEELAFLEHF